MQTMRWLAGTWLPVWLVTVMAVSLPGCRSPLAGGSVATADRRQPTLSQIVEESIARETGQIETIPSTQPQQPVLTPTTRPGSDVLRTLAGRRTELDAIGPDLTRDPHQFDLGADLTGSEQLRIAVGLNEIIAIAVEHNLSSQSARLQPGIAAEDVIAAEAAFDVVLFSGAEMAWIDQPQTTPVLNSIPLGTGINASRRYRYETGVRKLFSTGAQAILSTDLARYENRAPRFTLRPDPAYTAAARLGVFQPLLRGFGADVTRSTIMLSENAERGAVHALNTNLLEVVRDTEAAYWNLVLAWRTLAIQQWLVDVGISVRDVLERRQEFDTKPAEFSDAVAKVEQRRAEIIRARRLVRAASDALKALINDPAMTIGSETVLWPQDDLIDEPIFFNLRESMIYAIDHRPEPQQALLAIDDASILQAVASNNRLPLLNLSAEMAYFGLDEGAGGAYANLGDGDFIDYLLGLAFEYPLGNREADARLRQARLQRSAAVIGYQQAVQNVVVEVKSALRDVLTNYELIEATRSFRVAQAENLRTLLVEEDALAGLTPEFLNLKFTRQETLARARLEEVLSLVNFNKSLATLYRAMGNGLTMRGIDEARLP